MPVIPIDDRSMEDAGSQPFALEDGTPAPPAAPEAPAPADQRESMLPTLPDSTVLDFLNMSEADLADVVRLWRYYAKLARELDAEQEKTLPISDTDVGTRIRKEPVGVVEAITPWNYPLLMATQKERSRLQKSLASR